MTQNQLKLIVHYNPLTGIFTWLKDTGFRKRVGATAGCLTSDGYILIGIHNSLYKAHRLAWLYVYGEMPIKHIDHINHTRSDNRIINIREATPHINQKNMTMFSNNKTGFTGVGYDKKRNRYRATIQHKGKHIFLGRFITKEDAIIARKEANIKYGFHKNHGELNE